MNRIAFLSFIVMLAACCAMLIYGCGIFERFPADEVQTTTRPSEDTKEPPPDEDGSPPEPDALISETLTTWGGYLGMPLLSALGFLFGRAKPLRVLKKLTRAVQDGRRLLKTNGDKRARPNILRAFDSVLGRMDTETSNVIRKVKKKAKMASVTKPGE